MNKFKLFHSPETSKATPTRSPLHMEAKSISPTSQVGFKDSWTGLDLYTAIHAWRVAFGCRLEICNRVSGALLKAFMNDRPLRPTSRSEAANWNRKIQFKLSSWMGSRRQNTLGVYNTHKQRHVCEKEGRASRFWTLQRNLHPPLWQTFHFGMILRSKNITNFADRVPQRNGFLSIGIIQPMNLNIKKTFRTIFIIQCKGIGPLRMTLFVDSK